MHPSTSATEVPEPLTYRVCVKSHLSPDWLAMPGVTALSTDYDAAGWPTTSLLLKVVDRSQLMGILHELHDLNLMLLSLELVRTTHHRS